MNKIAVITGGSKGLGAGMVKAYSKQGYQVFSIARSKNNDFLEQNITQIEADLGDINGLEEVVENVFNQIDKEQVEKMVLINNAAALGKVGSIENDTVQSIQKTIDLNTTSPLILTSLFIKAIQDWQCEKKVINISSGAGLRAFPGWTVYCTTKAALNMMTQTIALDQNDLENPVKIIAIGPGIIDTNMQTKIRATDVSDFKLRDKFVDYKNSGALSNPSTVGQEIFDIDNKDNYENGAILSVNDYR